MALLPFKPFVDLLGALDKESGPLDEIDVMGKLNALLPDKMTSLPPEERRGVIADFDGFRFQRPHGSSREPWGMYWSEMASMTRADGTTIHSPEIAEVDDDIVAHWIAQSERYSHPILVARYSDLAWTIGQYLRKPPKGAPANIQPLSIALPVALVRRAVAGYLDSIERDLFAEEHHAWKFIERAMELSAIAKDAEPMKRAKAMLYALRNKLRTLDAGFMWWRFDDIAWSQSKQLQLDEAEQQDAIDFLEEILSISANPATPARFNPHDAMSAADRLDRRRAQRKELDEARRAMRDAARAKEDLAKMSDGMTAIAHFEDLLPRYRNAGMVDDVARIEALIRERAEQARGEMATFSVPMKLTQEDLDKWSATVLKGSLADGLREVALAGVVGDEAVHRQLKEFAKQAPLWSMISTSIMGDDGFTQAMVGSLEDDLDGRAIQHAANIFSWTAPWIHYGLHALREKHQFGVEELLPIIRECGIFKPERDPMLREGLAAWLTGDATKAIHVLVPQVEAALRDLLAAIGAPVTEPDHVNGGFQMIGFGKIINNAVFKAQVPKDLRFHLRALYCDSRGINLRNVVAHGLASADMLTLGTANWVIHTILTLGLLRLKPKDV